MLFRHNRWAGRQQLSRSPARRDLWTARGLLGTATVLLVWAGGSIVADQPVEPATAPINYGPALVQTENRRFVETSRNPLPLVQPPLERSARAVRAGGVAVQRPAATLEPTAIEIPALSIDRDLIELAVIGTDLQVPDDYADVGWWRDGPAPGEAGASVVAGHVDSPTGPAVFYQLSGLRAGDEIKVSLDDGSRTVFAVREVQLYERSQFPSARVYRTDGQPTLHLLTCGGSFDTEANQYSSNVVVYADLLKRIPAKGEKPGWHKRLTDDAKRKVSRDRRPDPRSQAGPRGQARQTNHATPEVGPEWYERLVQNSRERLRQLDSSSRFDHTEGVRQ